MIVTFLIVAQGEIVCCDSDDIQVNVFASTDDEINTSRLK